MIYLQRDLRIVSHELHVANHRTGGLACPICA
jgi:hypothetical protein